MNKTTFTILILAFTTICFGQATETKYFNSEWLLKEVPQNKAKFSQTIIQNADSSTTTEIEDLKKQEIIEQLLYIYINYTLSSYGIYYTGKIYTI